VLSEEYTLIPKAWHLALTLHHIELAITVKIGNCRAPAGLRCRSTCYRRVCIP
jgi:hypothetical protein